MLALSASFCISPAHSNNLQQPRLTNAAISHTAIGLESGSDSKKSIG